MKMTAKLLSVLLCAAMLVSLLPVTASAAVLGDLQYEVKDDHVVITLCKNTATSVNIPAQIDGLPVTEIGKSAFYGCSNLKSVTIPSSVTIIGISAFEFCSSLTSVTIPSGVTSIGSYAFDWCGYYNNTKNWKNGVLYIGDWLIEADEDTIPSNYTITSGTRGIADSAFRGCAWLESVTIPSSVTSIGNSAFYQCSALTSVTIPSSVTSIGEWTFYRCYALTNVTIPSNVMSIGARTFYECKSLKSINIPSGVTNIDREAFYGCSALTNVTIPSGVMNIDRYAFFGCSALTSVTILNGVKSIGEYAFSGCSALTSVTIPSSVTSIGTLAFNECDNLAAVYYGGSEAQWKNIDIGYSNSALKSATIHYLGTDESDPKPPVIEYPYTINGLSLVSVNGEALAAPPSDSAFMVNVELKETKSRSTQDYLFVAVYDTRGALLSLDYVRADFTYNSIEFGFYVPAQTRKIGSIKAFVWNGFNTEQPLCESVEIKN